MTIGKSFRAMGQLIRKSKGRFWAAVVLILLPVLLVTSYQAYRTPPAIKADYTVLDGVDWNGALNGDSGVLEDLIAKEAQLITTNEADMGFREWLLELLSFALSCFLDAFIILLGFSLIREKKASTDKLVGGSMKKLLSVILLGIIISWLFFILQSGTDSAVVVIGAGVYTAKMSHLMGVGMIIVGVLMGITSAALLMFLVTLLGLSLYYAEISIVLERTRFLGGISYGREILRGHFMRQMWRLMPFTAAGALLPAVVESLTIILPVNAVTYTLLCDVSVLLQVVASACMWFYLLPGYLQYEQTSGIQEKIRQAMEAYRTAREGGFPPRREQDNTEQNGECEHEEDNRANQSKPNDGNDGSGDPDNTDGNNAE